MIPLLLGKKHDETQPVRKDEGVYFALLSGTYVEEINPKRSSGSK